VGPPARVAAAVVSAWPAFERRGRRRHGLRGRQHDAGQRGRCLPRPGAAGCGADARAHATGAASAAGRADPAAPAASAASATGVLSLLRELRWRDVLATPSEAGPAAARPRGQQPGALDWRLDDGGDQRHQREHHAMLLRRCSSGERSKHNESGDPPAPVEEGVAVMRIGASSTNDAWVCTAGGGR